MRIGPLHVWSSPEPHGRRMHCRFGKRRAIDVECYWWGLRCLATVRTDENGWHFALALPPLALFVAIEGFPLWQPTRSALATWENPPRAFTVPDDRECRLAVHDWTIWFTPWGRSMEWHSADPWWVKGVTLNVLDVLFGKTRYRCDMLSAPITAYIDMPEGQYPATFTPMRQTWSRPRGFTRTRESFEIEIPKGIPFAGKGENSWDCGDDGLFGMSAEGTLEQAIAAVRETVTRIRKRYGAPSANAIAKALVPIEG